MLVNALGLKLFGLHAMAYRQIFSLLSIGAFLAFTIALLSRQTSRLLVGALVAFMISHYLFSGFHDSSINNSESVGLFFFMIGTSVLLLRTRWVRTQQVLGAAVLALAPLSKEPLVFVTLAAWLCLLSLHAVESGRPGTKRFAIFTVAGATGVGGIWLAYMLATHSLGWYIVQLKLSIAYTKNYAYQLGWFPRDPPDGVFAECWKRLRENYVNYTRIGPFVPLFAAALALSGRRFLVGCLSLCAVVGGLYGVTIGHGFAPHYFIMAMTGTFFAAAIGAIALDSYARRSGSGLRWWVGLSWVPALSSPCGLSSRTNGQRRNRTFPRIRSCRRPSLRSYAVTRRATIESGPSETLSSTCTPIAWTPLGRAQPSTRSSNTILVLPTRSVSRRSGKNSSTTRRS
jgi:hypothetical protein